MPDGWQKSAVAMQFFGKSGAQLNEFLSLGAEGIAKFVQEARRFGIVISDETANKADQFNDSLRLLKRQVGAVGLGIATELLPKLNELTGALTKAGEVNLGQKIGQGLSWAINRIQQMITLADLLQAKTAVSGLNTMTPEKLQVITDLEKKLFSLRIEAAELSGEIPRAASAIAQSGKGAKKTGGDYEEAAKKIKEFKAELLDLATFGGIPGREGFGAPTLLKPGEVTRAIFEGMNQEKIRAITGELRDFGAEARKIWEDTRTAPEKFGMEMAHLDELLKLSALDADTYGRAVRNLLGTLADFKPPEGLSRMQQTLKDMKFSMEELGLSTLRWADTSAGALANWIVRGGSFREVLQGIIQDFSQMIIKILIMDALSRLLGWFGGGGGTVTLSSAPGPTGHAAFGAMIPARAGGGSAFGGPFWVGERGPEIFMPPRSGGMIIPNNKLPAFGGAGFGGGAGIVQNIAIDARGADVGTVVKLTAMMQRENNKEMLAALADRQSRVA